MSVLRNVALMVAMAGAYWLLRGWAGSPGLLMRSCLAVGLLVVGLALWGGQHDRGCQRLVCMRRARWSDYLMLGSALVLAEVCFVVLTAVLAAPAQQWVDGMMELQEDGQGEGGSGEAGDEVDFNAPESGDWLFRPNLERQLSIRSRSKPGNQPEVFMRLKSEQDVSRLMRGRLHVRSFAFGRFDGWRWSAAPFEQKERESPIRFVSDLDRGLPGAGEAIEHRMYLASNPTGQNMFTALPGVESTDLRRLTQLSATIHQLPDLEDETEGYNYLARSTPLHWLDLIHYPLEPAAGGEGELSLPPRLRLGLEQTAEVFRHERNLGQQLAGLRQFLQDNYRYSLKTSNPGKSNPLEHFLYVEKQGYCEHFATAAAMLVRTLGVPSRIAYGWSGGRLYASDKMFVFRSKDAHAWTEIKLKGYGWVVFDTTPPDDDAIPETHAAPATEEAPVPEEVLQEQYESWGDEGLAGRLQLPAADLDRLGLILAVLGLCCFGFGLVRWRSRSRVDQDGVPLGVAASPYLLRFKQICAELGYAMPRGRTLRQQMEWLDESGVMPEWGERLLKYHYSRVYGGSERNGSTEKDLQREMLRWSKRMRAEQGED